MPRQSSNPWVGIRAFAPRRTYFWEVLVLLRKLLLAAVVVFLGSGGGAQVRGGPPSPAHTSDLLGATDL